MIRIGGSKLGFTLGRKIDLSYKTNLWVLIFSFNIFLISLFLSKEILESLLLAAGFFLCWALTREVDPQNDFSAFLAGGTYILAAPFFGGIELALLFWLLLMLRFISGITGEKITLLDIISVSGFSLFLFLSRTNFVFIMLLTLAFVLGYFRLGKSRLLKQLALVFSGITLLSLFFWPPEWGWIFTLGNETGIIIILIFLFSGFFVLNCLDEKKKITDDIGSLIPAPWIYLGQMFFIFSFWSFLFFENLGLSTYFLFFSVSSGVFLYQLIVKGLLLKKGIRRREG